MKITLSVLALTISLSAFGVSRIGGGKVASLRSQFEMSVEPQFSNLKQFQNLIRADGPPSLGSNGFVSQFIEIREFGDFFPELININREGTNHYFADRGWTRMTASKNFCIEVFTYFNKTATGLAATWGEGKGMQMQGPSTAEVQHAIRSMAANIQLEPGACAWK